jgi:hypothetical protein
MEHRRRCALVVVATVGLRDVIRTQTQAEVACMRHGCDALRIDGLQVLDESQDLVELPEHARGLGGVEFQSRQLGNTGDVGSGESQ